jgi:hypothetical protein
MRHVAAFGDGKAIVVQLVANKWRISTYLVERMACMYLEKSADLIRNDL